MTRPRMGSIYTLTKLNICDKIKYIFDFVTYHKPHLRRPIMSDSDAYQRVEDVRRFNRFYTKQIGVLHEGLLGSPFSLAEARVLYELAHREKPTATELAKALGLDAGYLSRILRGFQKRDLIEKLPSAVDGRQSLLVL